MTLDYAHAVAASAHGYLWHSASIQCGAAIRPELRAKQTRRLASQTAPSRSERGCHRDGSASGTARFEYEVTLSGDDAFSILSESSSVGKRDRQTDRR
jgi:hypothetical protein